MKILIAVPTFDGRIEPETYQSIWDMDKLGHEARFQYVIGYDCAKARNDICRMAKSFDYVLMVDSDIILPTNTLKCMLEEPVDIITGLYPHKNGVDEAEIFKNGTNDFVHRFRYDELEEGRIHVKGCGGGCLLINTKILDKLKFPWFKFVVYENGTELSEDLYFCCQVNDAGMKIYADTRIYCGHICKEYRFG